MGLPYVEELMDYHEVNEALETGPYDKVYIFQYMYGRVLLWQQQSGWVEIRKAQWAAGGLPQNVLDRDVRSPSSGFGSGKRVDFPCWSGACVPI